MAHTVVVTGSAGLLGAAMLRALDDGYHVIGMTRGDLDITDQAAVTDAVMGVRPAAIVNCASYNAVDAAEGEPVRALEVNAFAVESLARAAAACGAALVHYSTDFVFDGESDRPYTEDDPPHPKSVYAASKLLGEWLAAKAPRAFVLRVESLFGAAPGWQGRRSSVDKIIDGIESGIEVPVFTDRTVSPSYVDDIAQATRRVIGGEVPPGLYHCVNDGSCTWHALAVEAARQLGRAPRLKTVEFASLNLPAARPMFCALSPARLASNGFTMPSWQDALARYIDKRRAAGKTG
jgi:dTDP-4-dehydrorhamnose reductase